MVSKLLNLVAVATLAVMTSSFNAVPVSALSMQGSGHFVRSNHHVIARAKRQEPSATGVRRRCKPRPSVLPVENTTPAPQDGGNNNGGGDQNTGAPVNNQPEQPVNNNPPPPPPPPQGGGGGGAKVGVAWANPGQDDELQFWMQGQVSAVYAWGSYMPTILNNYPNIEFVPMLWGDGAHIGNFQRDVPAGRFRHILGFNEPDHDGQAFLDPGYAASLYRQHITPHAYSGSVLISPAPTNAPSGTTWLTNFMNACGDCQISVVAAHWYGTELGDFQRHVTDYNNRFGREVWVTEFACQNFGGGAQCSDQQTAQFLRDSTAWLDAQPFVGKYFYFGVLHNMNNVNYNNQLIGGDGRPNALGYEYIY